MPYRWQGYDEALLLYLLGLGSPTHPLPDESYSAWISTYQWKKVYDQEFLFAGPLFIHQLSHLWVDFRSIQDEYMRGKGIDYFENSRARDLCAAAVRHRQSESIRGVRRKLLGHNGQRRPRPGDV